MGKIIHHIHEPKIPPKIQIQTNNIETERNKPLLEITHKSNLRHYTSCTIPGVFRTLLIVWKCRESPTTRKTTTNQIFFFNYTKQP